MDDEARRRGRKPGHGKWKIHAFYGPRQARIAILLGTHKYPEIFRNLADALYHASIHPHSFKEFLDALVAEDQQTPEHPAAKGLTAWCHGSNLSNTDWALPLAARVVWSAYNSPVAKYVPSRDDLIEFTATAMLGSLAIKDHKHLTGAYEQSEHLKPVLQGSFITQAGYKISRTGDFHPALVSQWLAWRLIEVARARREGKRVPGWTALAKQAEVISHKPIAQHVRTVAEYAGVPTTLLE